MLSDGGAGLCLLSFDVEDWFQAERLSPAIARRDWERCELRVAANVARLLAILKRHDTLATFFVLGWIAERAPEIVARIQAEGHEIACHGYGHESLHRLGRMAFAEDLRLGKRILEDLTGCEMLGYRAPNFSITDFAADVLAELGFGYDSSLYPSALSRRYGTAPCCPVGPGTAISRLSNGLLEAPVATLPVLGRELPWGGGGYFRLYPYPVFAAGVRAYLRRRSGYVFYAHPWELDAGQPRPRGLPLSSRLLHYVALARTAGRLERLVQDFHFVPIRSGLAQMGLL